MKKIHFPLLSLLVIPTASFATGVAQPSRLQSSQVNTTYPSVLSKKKKPASPPPYQPYKKILPMLKKTVKIPVLLPTPKQVAKDIFQRELVPDNVYQNNKNSYIVFFEWIPTCHGAPICTAATMYGAKITKNQPLPINPAVQNQQIQDQTHDTIKLANHITGYLERDHIGLSAKSHLHTLTWTQDNVRYQLTLKEHNKQDFIDLANSAIMHGDWVDNSKA